MKYSVFAAIGGLAVRSHRSFELTISALPSLVMLLLSLSFAPGQVQAQCGSLSGPSTTWSDSNGSWGVARNWTGGTPNSSTNACILDGSSTVTLDTKGHAEGLQLASGNVLNIKAGGSLSLSHSSSLNFSSINSGTITNAFGGELINYGSLFNNSGTIANSGRLTNNDSIVFSSGVSSSFLANNFGARLINNGTIGLSSGALINNSGAYLTNNGTIAGADFANLSNSGTFVNNSTISLVVDSGIGNSAYFANSGTITIDAGGFGNGGTFNNSGTFSLTSISDPSVFSNSGTFNNSGIMNLSLGFNSSSFSNSGTLNNSGTINMGAGCGGCSTPPSMSNSGTLNNSGSLNITTDLGSTFNNGGTINNTGTINSRGNFTNSGAVMISSTGLFTTSTNYTQTVGTTIVDGNLTATNGAIVNIQGGTIGGTGTINGNVLMAGTMMPGDAPGTLTILGNYEQTSSGIFDEQMSPFSQAFLDVSGNVLLDPGAMLEISLHGGFNPLGTTISIMDFSTLSGQFANGPSFLDDGFLWDITYRQHEIDVTAEQAVPEPSSMLLLSLGSIALGVIARRKKWQNSEP